MTLAEARLKEAKRVLELHRKPGNTGGGRTPNWIRAEHQATHADLMTLARAYLEEGQPIPNDVLKYMETSGKYGLGAVESVSLENPAILDKLAKFTAVWWASKQDETYRPDEGGKFYEAFCDFLEDA